MERQFASLTPILPGFELAVIHQGKHSYSSLAVRCISSYWRGFQLRAYQKKRADMSKLALPHGLLIKKCASIRTYLLPVNLDIAYLDSHGYILKCIYPVEPTRFYPSGFSLGSQKRLGGLHALILLPGGLKSLHVRVGDRLEHPALIGFTNCPLPHPSTTGQFKRPPQA